MRNMGIKEMTEKRFKRCDAVIRDDLDYARSIYERLDNEEEKREYEEIIHDLECELGYAGFKAEYVLIILFWLICIIMLIQLRG